jgi:hypothetical protein
VFGWLCIVGLGISACLVLLALVRNDGGHGSTLLTCAVTGAAFFALFPNLVAAYHLRRSARLTPKQKEEWGRHVNWGGGDTIIATFFYLLHGGAPLGDEHRPRLWGRR